MIYIIDLNNNFSGKCYGIIFFEGKGKTGDSFLAARLRARGFKVTEKNSPPKKKGGK